MTVNVRVRGLQSYHYSWLASHPERTEAWLSDRLRDGFHVHHMDGDHSNDEPENLVLIDGIDHMRIHGRSVKSSIDRWNTLAKKRAATDAECQQAYETKAESGLPWVEVAKIVHGNQKPNVDRPWHDIAQPLANRVRKFAKRNGMPWPPK